MSLFLPNYVLLVPKREPIRFAFDGLDSSKT